MLQKLHHQSHRLENEMRSTDLCELDAGQHETTATGTWSCWSEIRSLDLSIVLSLDRLFLKLMDISIIT
jgi:hypothetical protein